jgi:hypothetical protein
MSWCGAEQEKARQKTSFVLCIPSKMGIRVLGFLRQVQFPLHSSRDPVSTIFGEDGIFG